MATGGRTFNGSTQSGALGTTMSLQLHTLSIHGWVKNLGAGGGALFEALQAGTYSGWRFAYIQGGYANGLSFYDGTSWNGDVDVNVVSNSNATWYPIGAAVNGSGTGNAGKLYAGGSSCQSFTPANISTPASVTKYFARDVDASYTNLEASEWAVWNSVLSDADYTNLAAGYSPQEVSIGTLVSHWRFNEEGGTLTDLISGLTMTLAGTPGTSSDGPTVNEPPTAGGHPLTRRHGGIPWVRGDYGVFSPRRF